MLLLLFILRLLLVILIFILVILLIKKCRWVLFSFLRLLGVRFTFLLRFRLVYGSKLPFNMHPGQQLHQVAPQFGRRARANDYPFQPRYLGDFLGGWGADSIKDLHYPVLVGGQKVELQGSIIGLGDWYLP